MLATTPGWIIERDRLGERVARRSRRLVLPMLPRRSRFLLRNQVAQTYVTALATEDAPRSESRRCLIFRQHYIEPAMVFFHGMRRTPSRALAIKYRPLDTIPPMPWRMFLACRERASGDYMVETELTINLPTTERMRTMHRRPAHLRR